MYTPDMTFLIVYCQMACTMDLDPMDKFVLVYFSRYSFTNSFLFL